MSSRFWSHYKSNYYSSSRKYSTLDMPVVQDGQQTNAPLHFTTLVTAVYLIVCAHYYRARHLEACVLGTLNAYD